MVERIKRQHPLNKGEADHAPSLLLQEPPRSLPHPCRRAVWSEATETSVIVGSQVPSRGTIDQSVGVRCSHRLNYGPREAGRACTCIHGQGVNSGLHHRWNPFPTLTAVVRQRIVATKLFFCRFAPKPPGNSFAGYSYSAPVAAGSARKSASPFGETSNFCIAGESTGAKASPSQSLPHAPATLPATFRQGTSNRGVSGVEPLAISGDLPEVSAIFATG